MPGARSRTCSTAGSPRAGRRASRIGECARLPPYHGAAVRAANIARSLGTAPTGQKTESVYRRYAITRTDDKADALAKVAALASPQAVMSRIAASPRQRWDGWTATGACKYLN